MKKLKAVRITFTYYGVGVDLKKAEANAWNEVSNDNMFQIAKVETEECDVEETNIDQSYLDLLLKEEEQK